MALPLDSGQDLQDQRVAAQFPEIVLLHQDSMASDTQHHMDDPEEERSWAGDFNPFEDPEERRVLFATLDSFRYVYSFFFLFAYFSMK